ncbi:MAG: V-type ATP synthase subunit I [Oscillibacter sp.]|nr:V-type ATP synthase subunit I [Oscillibacter sp.]
MITKMKRLRVMAMSAQKEELLKGLLHLGCVEISEPEERLSDPEWTALLRRGDADLTRVKSERTDVRTALEALKQYAPVKEGLFIRRKSVSEQDFLSPRTVEAARAASGKINDLSRTLSRLRNEQNRLNAQKAALIPWQSLDMPLESAGTEHAVFRLETCPAGTDLGAVRTALGDAPAEVYEVSAGREQTCALLMFYRDAEEDVQNLLRPYNFSATSFPGLTGTAADNIARLDADLSENQAEQDRTVTALSQCGESRDALRLYADRLNAELLREENAGRLLTDGTVLFFEGWAPEENMQPVRSFLDRNGCAWEEEAPGPEDRPPVALKNNWFTRPLNMVTEMYSLPDYHNVDPNPLMAPFFILFYGIMMADMGYGLLMILAGLFITRKYKPKGTAGHLFGLLTLCGFSTFLMGAVTGGFFGDFLTQAVKLTAGGDFTLPALFTPLDDTLMILVGAMCLGFVQIVTGMAISFAQKIRKGQVMDAVWEELTWWIVFAGLGLMIAGITPVPLILGGVMVVAGPVVTGEGMGKVTGIFGSVYSHVTGYFGDILSYSRLMALMLAGSVIAQVFNTLGAIPGNIVIFLIISLAGNTLNFALNLLGCYVHDLRLQCLEYFGKFYEDGGQPFRPLAIQTKFVDVTPN